MTLYDAYLEFLELWEPRLKEIKRESRYIPSHRRLFRSDESVSATRPSCGGRLEFQIIRRLTMDIRHRSVSERCCTYHKPFWFSFWAVHAPAAGHHRRPVETDPSPQPPSSPPNRRGPCLCTTPDLENLHRGPTTTSGKSRIYSHNERTGKARSHVVRGWFVMGKNLPSGNCIPGGNPEWFYLPASRH